MEAHVSLKPSGQQGSNILTLLLANTWNHVPTSTNPADCASRGLLPQELLNFDLWWNGPPWLQIQWPPQPVPSPFGMSELKANVCVTTLTSPEWIEGNFSSYDRLLRVNAWILLFIFNLKLIRARKHLNLAMSLSVSELHSSKLHLFSLAQNRHFHDECSRLSLGKHLTSHSRLISLNPFLGDGGRSPFQLISIICSETPPILPSKDVLTALLVSFLHVSICHSDPSLLLSSVGSRVHILGARRLVRDICRRCVICRRTTARAE